MSDIPSGTIDGKKIRIGDRFKITREGIAAKIGSVDGEIFEIRTISIQFKDPSGQTAYQIGLEGERKEGNRSNLDGKCPPFQGIVITSPMFFVFFERADVKSKFIGADFEFRNRNLVGMGCRVLQGIESDPDNVFVEFEEDVGGCCGDGLGKSGHCLLISKNILRDKIEEIEGRKKTRRKKEKKKKNGRIKGGKLKKKVQKT
jgi:hypothetical protein